MSLERLIELAANIPDVEKKRKYHPVLGTAAAWTLPGIPAQVAGVGTLGAIVGKERPKGSVLAQDRGPVISSLKKAAAERGAGFHESRSPLTPAFAWRRSGIFEKLQRQQVENLAGPKAAKATTGVGLHPNIRAGLREGVAAHEVGHILQPKVLTSAPISTAAKLIPGAGAFYAATTRDEGRAKKAAIGSAVLGGAGVLTSEIDASVRGSRLLKKAGVKGLKRLSPFVGLPSYAAAASVPLLTYGVKKGVGGYRKKQPQGQ